MENEDVHKFVKELRTNAKKGKTLYFASNFKMWERIMKTEYEKVLSKCTDDQKDAITKKIQDLYGKNSPDNLSLGQIIRVFDSAGIFVRFYEKYKFFNKKNLYLINDFRNEKLHDKKQKDHDVTSMYILIVDMLNELGYKIPEDIHRICSICHQGIGKYDERTNSYLCDDCLNFRLMLNNLATEFRDYSLDRMNKIREIKGLKPIDIPQPPAEGSLQSILSEIDLTDPESIFPQKVYNSRKKKFEKIHKKKKYKFEIKSKELEFLINQISKNNEEKWLRAQLVPLIEDPFGEDAYGQRIEDKITEYFKKTYKKSGLIEKKFRQLTENFVENDIEDFKTTAYLYVAKIIINLFYQFYKAEKELYDKIYDEEYNAELYALVKDNTISEFRKMLLEKDSEDNK